MHWYGIALILIALFFVTIKMYRARKRRQRVIQKTLKHPTGYIKYHPRTHTQVKAALGSRKDARPQAVAVLNFKGDLQASQRLGLARLVDEILLNREEFSEVVVKIESPGGSVTDYGHAYAELERIKRAGLVLTACVDTVAASGGYLMCLAATTIIAAPFAMVGSIGVVSFVPNVRRLLERLLIEPRTFTAGEHKRTVSLTDNATPEQQRVFQEQLNLIHEQFKRALKLNRPQVDLAKVATGEAWLAEASRDLALGLVDEIAVSAEHLLERNRTHDLVEFSEEPEKKGWLARLLERLAG